MKVNPNNLEQLFDPEKLCKEDSSLYLGINQCQKITLGTLGDGKGYPAEVTKNQEKA